MISTLNHRYLTASHRIVQISVVEYLLPSPKSWSSIFQFLGQHVIQVKPFPLPPLFSLPMLTIFPIPSHQSRALLFSLAILLLSSFALARPSSSTNVTYIASLSRRAVDPPQDPSKPSQYEYVCRPFGECTPCPKSQVSPVHPIPSHKQTYKLNQNKPTSVLSRETNRSANRTATEDCSTVSPPEAHITRRHMCSIHRPTIARMRAGR